MTDHIQIDRRALLERVLMLTGAAALTGFAGPVLADTTAPATFLDAKQMSLLSAVADTIVPRTDTPGAIDAGVPASFDALLLSWASPARRQDLIQALQNIDQSARQAHKTSFAKLKPALRYEFLKAYDVAALSPKPGQAGTLGAASVDPAYAKLKELIVVLYYLSEAALTSELSYEHAPGEWKPSIPVTPTTRPTGGPALI